MHLTAVYLELISVLAYVFTKEGANMLIDTSLHARTDDVWFTKFCDLIKGHIRVKRS